jgi:putative DNA primase/helicase
VNEGAQAGAEKSSAIPRGFELQNDGLYKIVVEKDTGEEKRRFVCSRIEVVCRTRDQNSNDWGKLVRFSDPDRKEHEYVMPESLLASPNGDWLSPLTSRGLRLSDAKNGREDLKSYLNNSNPTDRARKVDQIGWHGHIFVTPAWTKPVLTDERIVLDDQGTAEHYFNPKGTLEDWRSHVAALCAGNSLLTFAVSAAFAPILLPLRSGMGGGFHLASNSSTGKSTTLVVAGSVWGGGGKLGFGQSWNATANGIESMAQAHNHCLLCLDEIKELPAEQAGRVAYELANGQGRARMMRDTRRGKRATWELLFLSTGEFGFIAHIESGGMKGRDRAYAGQEVRVCEIPFGDCKYGGFDELHGSPDGGAFAQRLVEAARKNHGIAAPEFVAQVVSRGFEQTNKSMASLIDNFPYDLNHAKADPAVNRVLLRFAFVGAAGELATEWGITGWKPNAALYAASDAFRLWLKNRGTFGSFDDKRALEQIRESVGLYGQSRFQHHHADPSKPLQVRWGYIVERTDGDREYQLPTLPREFCGAFSKEVIVRALGSINALVKEGDRFTTKRQLPGEPNKTRCYVIRHSALFSDSEQ